MKDELFEKVARAIYAASGGETPDFVLESVPDWELYDSEARAAIRVVVEECARVVDRWAAVSFPAEEKEAVDLARAIRKLAEEDGE